MANKTVTENVGIPVTDNSKGANVEKAQDLTKETLPKRKKVGRKPGPAKKKRVESEKPASSNKVSSKNTSSEVTFGQLTVELEDKKLSEDAINAKVRDYLKKHPYIHAEKIDVFIKPFEKKVYFTVNGYGNADFVIEL